MLRLFNTVFFRNRVHLIAIALCLMSLTARVENVQLRDGLNEYAGTRDNTIYGDNPDHTGGGIEFIYSGATLSSQRRTLIKFDLAPIPPGSRILSVELRLVVDRAGRLSSENDLFTLHRLERDWGEGVADTFDPGGLGVPAEEGDATWNNAMHTIEPWTHPGGDFTVAASASTAVGADQGDVVIFSSHQMTDNVQAWLDNPPTNYGWILIGPEQGQQNARRFYSRDYQTIDLRPILAINYDPPNVAPHWLIYS